MTISGKPLSGPIVSGRPVRWPGPRPVPPGSAIPPTTPPPDPGPITPPGPRGEPPPKVDPPDTIHPGGQPPTPAPEPPMPPRQPGMHSDAFVALGQTGGSIVAEIAVRGQWTGHEEITFQQIGADAANLRTFTNRVFAPFYDPGNATAIRPWMYLPPGSNAPRKSASKEKLMADTPTFEQEILAGLAELRHGLAVLGDQIAALAARLDSAPSDPPATAEDPEVEFWSIFFSTPLPDAGTFTPEVFTSYDRGRVLYQWLANHTPLGKRVYRDVAGEMATLRVMWEDPTDRRSRMFQEAGVGFECAVYAILSGRCDDLFGLGLDSGLKGQILALAGKSAADLFAADIAGDKQGGSPGIGG